MPLALIGGAASLLVSAWLTDLLVSHFDGIPRLNEVGVNGPNDLCERVDLTAVLFGLAPLSRSRGQSCGILEQEGALATRTPAARVSALYRHR
jgi:hypothetical protein